MRPSDICRTIVPALALLAGCSSATSQRAYVAPTNETIVSTTEERQGEPPVHLIMVENRSTVPVTVFSVSLTACENVKQQCSPQRVRHRIPPGSRQTVIRVEPDNINRGFSYRFNYSWHADSATAGALEALAAGGDERSRDRLVSRQRADSVGRTDWGRRYKELTREDFAALAGRATMLRPPDSLVIEPGKRVNIEGIHFLVADSAGTVFGRTGWLRWIVPSSHAAQFIPPAELVARAPGRLNLRFRLAEEAEALLQRSIPEVAYPVVVAYPPDPHAPTFAGLAVDADSKTPLGCARVALEDSLQNVVATSRTARDGSFVLNAPRPGTYRVRVDIFGWAPVYSPPELANADEVKQHQYSVKFVEQMLMVRRTMAADDFQHAYPSAVTTGPIGGAGRTTGSRRNTNVPIVQSVTLGGSESMPILGIIGNAPAGTTWMQFVVDSTGAVDSASVTLPPGTSEAAIASVRFMLPRVRFSPAREGGRPTCELLRMQVNFSPR